MRLHTFTEPDHNSHELRCRDGRRLRVEELGTDKQIQDVMDLQEIIMNSLTDPTLFYPDTFEFYKKEAESEGKLIGVYHEGALAAYSLLSVPGDDESNLGYDLGIPAEELPKVAHMEMTVVHPVFRGEHFQKQFTEIRLHLMRALHMTHACATVHPDNHASVRNILDAGLAIRLLKYKYGEKLRYVAHKSFALSEDFEHSTPVKLSPKLVQDQQDLLGQGYYGVHFENNGAGPLVHYKKPRVL